jgi:Protein of unknown function (DUF4446)
MEGLSNALQPILLWVQAQPALALGLLLLLQLVTMLLGVIGLVRGRRLATRQARMLRGVDGASLENLLMDYSSNVSQFQSNLEQTMGQSDKNAAALRQTLRRVGLHRYDAFANVGGLQSFSLALLDDGANGVVLSGLYSRQEMRVYAKPIVKGTSEITLTPEEQRAISEARLPGKEA